MATKGKKNDGTAELRLEGVDVAPGVLDTIVVLAAEGVDGVACVEATGLAGLMAKSGSKGSVEVGMEEGGAYDVTLHLSVEHGKPIRTIAAEVQEAVADALLSQTGVPAPTVNVFVDAIVFPE